MVVGVQWNLVSIKSDVPEKKRQVGFDENGLNVSDVDVAMIFDFRDDYFQAKKRSD